MQVNSDGDSPVLLAIVGNNSIPQVFRGKMILGGVQMPRFARIKPAGVTYHIMCRSVSEVKLFACDEDKQYYLDLLKKYCDRYQCSVYAYCLLDNHLHIHFDPKGFDLSKFMHSLNTAYVIYFNKKYKRHGHLFQGRFESKIVSSDAYAIALSSYIHNNPKDVEGYRGREEEYPFSSMGFIVGKRKDSRMLVDTGFILSLFSAKSQSSSIRNYIEFVKKQDYEESESSIKKCLEQICINIYDSGRILVFRNLKPEDICRKIVDTFGVLGGECMKLKYNRTVSHIRSYVAFVMRSLCSCSYSEICRYLGDMTISGVSKLCSKGFKVFKNNIEYQLLFNELSGLANA